MSKSVDTAKAIAEKCRELGWTFAVSGSILTIQKRIRVDSKEDFMRADMEYYSIFSLLPTTRPGSVWGTDGGGIGALTAMNTGVFTMKKSGGNKLVLKALAKM